MGKSLSEMTIEELWELFPILLKEHNPAYEIWYENEKADLLQNIAGEGIMRINHIGSTAVSGLIAKPTVDILLEVKRDYNLKELEARLTAAGWILMLNHGEPEFHMAFNKGYTPEGFAEKVFHLHVKYYGDWDELYFRDYLREHREAADEYARLKMQLATEYNHNRDAYTDAKKEFVYRVSSEARECYGDRYLPKE